LKILLKVRQPIIRSAISSCGGRRGGQGGRKGREKAISSENHGEHPIVGWREGERKGGTGKERRTSR